MQRDDTLVLEPSEKWPPLWRGLAVALVAALGFAWLGFNHEAGSDYGVLSLLPAALVITMAVLTRKTVESLLAGALLGLLLLDPGDLVSPLADVTLAVMMDETIAWLILVCGMMGGLINLLARGGGVHSFGNFMTRLIKSPSGAMFGTVGLGLVVFIDDYLNSLAVSSSMKKITDTYKISREKLAYIVDSTAAPICILVPISTWAVFFASLLEDSGAADGGRGMSLYIQSIPYMLYGWAALLVVVLVAANRLPDLGAMKQAEARARAGQPVPTGWKDQEEAQPSRNTPAWLGLGNFLLPMLVLVLASAWYEIDLLKGVLVALGFTMLLYSVQRLLSFQQQVDATLDGFKVMLYPIATVCAGFVLKEVNDQLGMTQYIIDTVTPILTPALLPAVVFLVMALVVFSTASSWGVFVISLPIVVPLAQAMAVPMPLVVGALLSASAFGSHACFFSDSTVLSAQGAGCDTMDHALTQLPYALIGGALTLAALLAAGFWLV
ncbi:sodium:proton antiporter [Zobellella denitrificans]|uniref:Na+/H+ antiporter NhaC family protein n=1 Tax=Zobellella denitrificans TaxID=347534 RepID=UPI000B8BE14A|nr:Na+/H+ antiporter NhaC family protein [Zobellella denitrificans]OXS16741.1 sodium:proton antiporter [Zobellella denitrificans]